MTVLDPTQNESKSLSCMEVWGGNQPANMGVKTFGLDAWLFSQPFEDQSEGGDVHFLSSCASGNITRILLADVSGHGSSVSSVATQLRDLMRRNVNRISHRKLVSEVNDEFTQLTEVGCFATALVFSYFAPKRQLSVSNAGHPAPFVFNAQQGKWRQLTSKTEVSEEPFSDVPFGVESAAHYTDQTIPLEPGDIVFCFSDAIIEMETKDGTQVGIDRLFGLVQELDTSEPDQMIPRLMSRLSGIAHNSKIANDDVTALLFRAHETTTGSRLIRICLAPLRLFLSRRKK